MSKDTTMTKTAKTPLATKIVAVFMAVLLAFLQVPIKGLSGEALADAVADAQAQLTGNTSVDVPLTFEHAYITYADQVIATPATKVTIPVNSDLSFTASADSGYQLESVTATIDGNETKLKADEKGFYKLTAAEVAITTDILVKGITEPTVETAEIAADDIIQAQSSDASNLAAQQVAAAASAAPMEAEASGGLSAQAASAGATVISSDNASVTVAVYPTSADRSARTNALTSDYEVSVSETLYGAVHFDFKPGEGPKSGRLTYTYTMPSNIKTADKAVATLYDDGGNVAGTWEIKGGTVYFNYDEAWANAHPNGGGNFNFDFTLDEEQTETGGDSTFSFPGATETITVKVKEAEMIGSKTNSGVDEDGYVTYTVKLTAQADFSTFNFSDHLESSLDYVEGSFTFDGSPLAVTITANADGTHDAVASMTSIAHGDHVITYRTKVDQDAFDKLANWQVLNDTRNTATWKYGNDGELKQGSADSWLWLQKNLVNKWQDGGVTDGNKIKWVAQINGSTQFKSDLANYTATDSLGNGLSYEGTYIVYNADWQVYDTGTIPSGATSFTYEFKGDAGHNTYYLVYTTIVNDPSTAQALSNEIVVTPPDGGTPTDASSSYNYDPRSGDPGNTQTIEPDVTKEVADQSEALTTGVVSWHSTLTSENYPEPEQKSGLVMQYFDSLENWMNKMYVSNSSSGEAYYRIWFVGEPELYANGTKLVKGVDYQFDERGGNIYGYYKHAENFAGESVPVAYRIRFILDSDTMSKVVENKTPIDIYYDTQCDGTYQKYYNEGRVRIVSGNTEVYGKSDSDTYTLTGESRTTKTGWMWFDEGRGKYVAQWEMVANRADNWDCMTPLTSPYFTFTDTLPEGMSVIEDSIDLWVVRPESSGLKYISVNPSYTFSQEGRTATVTTDLRNVPLQSWQQPFYDESTGKCYAWAQLRFQTELDPAYVVHDGTEQTLRNTVVASSGDQTFGTGQAAVSYSDQVISKSGSQSDGEPVVHYRIEVNTKGQKLDSDSTHTSVNLKDTLDYRSTVVLSSIKVTDYHTGENVTDQCVVTLDNDETDGNNNATSSFTVNVPDERALVITYDVKLSGSDGQWLEVTNSASLSGITNKQTNTKQWFKVNHADASVYGSNTAISLTKTDSSNVVGSSALLSGAVFELYSVDLSKLPEGDYTADGLAAASTKVNTVTTDSSGSAVLYDEATKALQYDTLYYFKEVKAPIGYAIDDGNPHFVMTQGSNYEAQSALAASHGIHASPNTSYNVTDTKKTSTLLKARKVYENGELEAGAFTFELREGGKLIETKTNDAEGNVSFTNIEYDAAGSHTYTIAEVAGSEDYIDYDRHTVTVSVNVVNDGRGSYYAEATYPDGGDEAVFTNTYHATGQAELAATKTLNGAPPANGAFSFTLSGADGVIQTVANDATGSVKFNPLTFDASDVNFDSIDEHGNRYAEFTYTIAENAPADARSVVGGKVLKNGVFYDASLHSVTVRVTDDGDGSLDVTYDGDTTFEGASFANTHDTVNVSGAKEWDDGDDQDGIRPASVTVHLLADGVDTGRLATATADGGWQFAFSGLDKYGADGNAITYTVSEDAVSGYTAEVSGSVADGFTITNVHAPEKTQVPVRKVWDDANNQDGIRNSQVYVNLLADGEATGNRVKLSEKNNWSFTFTDLPKYADGKLISYSIKETTSLKEYEKPAYSADGETLVVTNSHTPQTTEVAGTKSWQDNGNADGNRPASVTVRLLADGEEVGSQVVTEAAGWSYSFTGLPVYKPGAVGQEIAYSVQEDVPSDYIVSAVDDGIVNTYERDATSVTVTKAWDDENDKDGVRPESVSVQLLANGSVYDIQDLTAASGWTYTWSDLPKRLDGADVTYTVTESNVEGYELVSTVGNPSSGYTLTNKHEPESGDAQLTLIKSSTTNSDARLFGAQFTLTNVADPANTESVTTDWYGNATFTKLKRGQTYTLQETAAPGGYILDETVYTFTVSDDTEPIVQCTSGDLSVWGGQASYWTWLENQPDSGYGSIIVQKTLVGSDGVWGNVSRHPEIDTVRAGMQVYAVNVDTGDYFTFQSIGNAARYTRKADLYGSDGSVKGQVTITPAGSMASKVANLPSGTWWVTEYADGMTSFDGDNGAYSGSSDSWTRTTTYTVNGESTQLVGTSSDENQLKTIEITNNYYSNGSLVLSKEFGWEYDNLPGKYAGNLLGGKEEGATGATGAIMSNITFKITGQNLGEAYTIKGNGFDKSTPTEVVSESGNTAILVTYTKQQWTITNLPYDTYTVVEQSDGYRDNGAEIDTILHKFYTTGTFEVSKDASTTNVSVGNTTGQTSGEGVSETGATVDVNGDDETLNVLNIYYRPKVVEATKAWSIPEGMNYTPQDIEVQLVRSVNGVDNAGKWQQGYFYPVTSDDVPEHPGYVTRKTLHWNSETNSYDKVVFSQLPAVTANGEQITYEVREVSADGSLVPMVNGSYTDENGDILTDGNTYIAADGTTATATWGDGWSPGKAPYADVDGVSRYYSSDKGLTIVNTLQSTEVEGTKTWDDANNQDGVRPASITVRLHADGREVARKSVSAADGWTYDFTGLPMYANGAEIEYTVTEDAVPGYETTVDGTDIVNTHKPETITVKGSKTWDDANDQDGARPDSIVVRVFNGTTEVASKTVTPDDDGTWSYEFSGLPKYANGAEIAYTVTEDAVAGYTTAVNGYNITNSHTPETTQVSGRKTWEDADNQDGKRPTSVTVRLYADGKETASTTATAASNWVYSFSDLPKFSNGVKIDYTVSEDAIEGYEAFYDGYDIANAYQPETFDLSGSKTWDDADDQDGKRPASVTVRLFADGEEIDSSTASAANQWSYEFTDLPVYDNGKRIEYEIVEDAIDGYVATYSGFSVVNTHTPETTEVSGSKTWDDADDQDGKRPASVTVRLLADGEEVDSRTLIPDADGNWPAYSFVDLPVYADGEKIDYAVEEDAVAGYESNVDGYDITNTHVPETTEVSGSKTWDDADDQDGKRPASVTVRLLADGEEVDSATVTSANGWSYSFANLPKYAGGEEIEYTVEEDEVKDYEASYDGYDITNFHTPETTEVSGVKTWDDADDQDGKRPAVITVRLYANGAQVDSATVSADADGNWTYSFANLPMYEDGQRIAYTVAEDAVAGYTTAIDGFDITNTHTPETTEESGRKAWVDADDQDGARPDKITVRLLADGEEVDHVEAVSSNGWAYSFPNLPKYANGAEITYTVIEDAVADYQTSYEVPSTILNTHSPKKTSVSGSKVWVDADDQDGKRPASVTVHLLANGADTGKSATVTADDDWRYEFADLDKYANGTEITYSVTEDTVADYTTSINGYTTTNTHQPETTQVSGVKTWVDNDDQDGKRPDSVTVRLLANGKEVNHAVVDAGGNWAYAFTGLPAFANGKRIVYTVEEDAVDSYTTSMSGTSIINTHTPERVTISGTKTWDDANNQDGIRPPSVTVRLYADGSEVASTTATADGNWAYRFADLPKYADGEEIAYTVSEDAVPGYTAEVDGYDITNAHTPETTEVSGAKAWDDADDQDGLRPASIVVRLYADGSEVDHVAVNADEDGVWSYEFTDLPVFANGQRITYTVGEDAVANYTAAINGFDITNTHTPETTEVSGSKTWDDVNNQDGIRPSSVTVRLYADGSEVASTAATAATGWSYRFANLPKYANGEEIEYAVVEDAVSGYTPSVDGFNIANTHTPETTEFAGKKVWDDADDQDGIRPSSITVHLLANGVDTGKTANATEEDNWSYSFTDLDAYASGVAIVYSVTEESVPGYTTSVNGSTVVNAHTPETTEVSGTKTWDDADDQDGIRPSSVTVRLYADGEQVDSTTVSAGADGSWSYRFADLPKYADGEEIAYTVSEDAVEGYETSYDGYDITNAHTPETTEVSGSKTWNDADDQDGARPTSIVVRLLANGSEVDSTTVTSENDWSYRFTGLPKYAAGEEISYAVQEDAIDDYQVSYDKADIINTHKPDQTSLSGVKVWADGGDQDGIRPASITVHLFANGVDTGKTAVATVDNDWRYAFSDLDKFANGTEIAYTVTEDVVSGYTTAIEGTTITNTHVPETTEVSGAKTWDDANNQDGIRPSSVTVRLYADGSEVASTAATADGNWAYRFADLPKYADGEEIAYTVSEDAVPGYTAEVDGYDITNAHTPETTEVSGAKTWDDADDQDGIRPSSVTVNLLANGIRVDSATVTAADGWRYSFANLPAYAAGSKIVYTVSEEAVSGYRASYDGYDIVNTHVPETTEVAGVKIWVDHDDQDGIRPSSVTVRLYADGSEVASAAATADDNWAYSFTNLPKYAGGEEIAYTVEEDAVEGYDATHNDASIINTHTPETTEVSGTKTWDDADDQDGIRPSSVTVRLYADGEQVDSAAASAGAGGSWSYRFADLPKYAGGEEIAYTVSEDAVEGYETSYDGYDITNAHTPETTEVSGAKTWDDADDQDGIRPSSVTVRLYADGEQVDSATATAATGWSYRFADLPMFKGGQRVVYTVSEDSVEGYITQIDGFDVSNTHVPEKTSMKVVKDWQDENDYDGLRPADVRMQLYANAQPSGNPVSLNEASGWAYTWTNLDKYADGTEIEYTVAEVSDDALEAHYTTSDPEYDATRDAQVITNTHEVEKVSVKGIKRWSDVNNQDGKRPETITVDLLANGSKVKKQLVVAGTDGTWSFEFSDLDKYANGEEIVYTVTEEQVEGYTATITGNATSGFVIDNAYTPEETEVTVTKAWDDADNQDGVRPASITVRLLANGALADIDGIESEVQLTSDNGWAYSWSGLDRYQNGQEITYTVEEDAVTDYAAELAGSATSGFTLKNTHAPSLVDVTVDKAWVDADNQDGLRPDSVEVQLRAVANGEVLSLNDVAMKATLSEGNNWHYAWKDLPRKHNGAVIAYSLVELDDIDGYTSAVTSSQKEATQAQNSAISFTVTNTHAPELVNVPVNKSWDDANNQDGRRPASIGVQLYADGEPALVNGAAATATLNAANGWAAAWNNLPKYAHGSEIVYSVTETAVPDGYEKISDGVAGNGFTLTNKHDIETIDVSARKVWNDADNQDGVRGDYVTVELFANGEKVQSGTLNDENDWSITWENLPKFANGVEIDYTLSEAAQSVPAGYSAPAVAKSTVDGTVSFTVTNTHTPETVEVRGVKAWSDANNQDGVRPASITVNLLKNGVREDSVRVTPDADGNWTYAFTNLPKFEAGAEIAYTVSEEAVEGYTTTIDGYNITNSYKPGETAVSVSKTWHDADDQDGVRPAQVKVQLYADGEASGNPVTLNAANGWSYTWEGLAKKSAGEDIDYTVSEIAGEDWSDDYESEIAGDMQSGFTITNTHAPEKTTARVVKVWDDADNQDGKRPTEISVQLLANGEAHGAPVTLNEQNSWSFTWDGLDKKEKGSDISYTLAEVSKTEDYTTEVVADGTIFTVTNAHEVEYIDIPVTKEWDDNDDQDGLRPDSIVVRLMDGDDEVDTLTLNAAHGWTGVFEHLPKYKNGSEIAYTLEEAHVDGYTSDVEGSESEGFVVTNAHTPAVTSAEVLKSWDDANNQDGKRPTSITVQLLANDGAYGDPVTLSASNGWAYKWDNLPLKQGGAVVDYAVTESGVPDDYTASVEGDRESGFVITNSYTPGVRNITAAKAWDDASDQDGMRSGSIKVRLLADGEEVAADGVASEIELNSDNHWAYTWENLDQMRAGQEIAYTVEEVEVPEGYRSTTSGSAEEGYTITNVHVPEETTLTVSKEWDDDANRDGVRPAGIELTLYADAQPVASQTIVPDASGNWSYTFEHLPKYASGSQIAYTVDEKGIDQYTGSVDGATLLNSHDNAKTSVAGKKTWNDNDNQDSTRPDSITVRLLADGEEIDAQEVTAADGWAYAFEGLNKFRNGGVPIVYTIEEDAVRNYTAEIDGYNVSNTLDVGSLAVSKTVRNTTTSAAFSFTVTLDDQRVNGVHGGMVFTDGVATFELADGERIVATDLPAGVGYTVEEADRAGYESTSTGATGMVVAGQNATASFDNAYSATGTAEFYAMKTLDGRTLGPDEFTFQLLENGRVLQTVQNAGDGHARFEVIEYTLDDRGEHTYTIREARGDARGVTYDESEYTVTTNVTDNGDGTLRVEYGEYDPESGVPFKNSYAPSGSVELEVNKLLDGQVPAAGAYAFQVADAQGKVYAMATNDASGKVKFPALTFKAAGTYAYTISEVVPAGAQRLGPNMIVDGVAYDASTVGVTIEAYDNFDGTMRFETSYDTEDATFNNTSVPDTSFPLRATKVMQGRSFASGDTFTFTVEGEQGAPMPASRQVAITPADGSSADVDFGDITFTAADLGNTYTYTIKETPAAGDTRGVTYDPFGHWVKLTVGDAGDGTMNVTAEYQNDADGIVLTNTYAAQGEAVLGATKTLSGRDLADGEFFFELEGDNLPATLHASAAADGSIEFAPIEFTQEDAGKTFHYTMRETQGTLGGVSYDTSSYDIAVSVADNGDGTLAISYDYGDSPTAPVFRNAYEAAGTSAQLTAHKALVGATLEGGEFTFQLTGVSANAQGEDQTAVNDANGRVSFDSIEFADAGVYQYRISEVVPPDARDNGDGTFTGSDGIVYDGRSHTATVTVTDDGYGALHAAVAYDQGASGISFGNTELVRTGFAFNKYFFGGVGAFDFTMTAVDAQGNAREGSIADYSSAATIVDDGAEAFKATVQNGAFEGDVAQIVFPEISFAADGDYYYLVEEEQSNDPTVVIDEAKYLVHVVVENNQVASTTYNLIYSGHDFGATTDLSFYNNSAVTLGFASQSLKAYSEAGQRVSVYPEAQKYLNGGTDQLVGDDFTFELIDEASGTVLAQATNDEFGKIAFYDEGTDPGLVYDEPGTYRYIMREVAGDEANVEYDTSSISMTVNVVQGDEGLEATITYNGPGGADPAFYNIRRGMDVTVQKVSRYGGEGLVDCTYALWMVGLNGDALIKEATSDANGYITFNDVTLIAGQKYYFKEVEAPKGHTVDPYRTAYFSLNETGDGLVLVEATAADGWHSATENIELDKARQ